MEKWQINGVIAVLGTLLINIFGGWDTLMQMLVIICIIDYTTGILSAIYEGNLSSKIGYKGIIKKVGMFSVVAVACIISTMTKTDLLREATIIFYISNEGISILENVGKTGVRYPKKLKAILKQCREKGGCK